jgi:hypothetical protein
LIPAFMATITHVGDLLTSHVDTRSLCSKSKPTTRCAGEQPLGEVFWQRYRRPLRDRRKLLAGVSDLEVSVATLSWPTTGIWSIPTWVEKCIRDCAQSRFGTQGGPGSGIPRHPSEERFTQGRFTGYLTPHGLLRQSLGQRVGLCRSSFRKASATSGVQRQAVWQEIAQAAGCGSPGGLGCDMPRKMTR